MSRVSLPYVALGDSYAAGVGGGPGRSECWRAFAGYPVSVARSLGVDLAYQACLGATVANVVEDQVAALGPETTHVSLTIGGNDAGFVPVLVECAKPAWMTDSDRVLDEASALVTQELPGRLDALLGRVREGAPTAELVLTAYPVIFNGTDCNALTFFSPHEMSRIERGTGELADVISAAAAKVGARFVDPRAAFDGHAVCDAVEWINGVGWPLEESYHPNGAGHEAYARLVAEGFGVEPSVLPQRDRPEVRVEEGPARRGDAPTFSLPDLLSGPSLDGARRAGIDPDRVVRLVREDRREELQELDREVRASR
ncbi:lysophospholipase L1-like esterase [Knoellia remsis]|uniref:Lysophospholipase L1-like esterase n=1 Tax=Knoellia remsis TaxID=407159 RepID=A0A2T0UGP3_9MICO|nr:lysophospholipase L1-like esterase [Knoellia remsis]